MKLSTLNKSTVHQAIKNDLAPVIVLEEEEEDKKEKGKEQGQKVKEDPTVARAYDQTNKTQEEIAGEVGVHPSTVSRWKSKDPDIKRNPRHKNLADLVQALGQQPFDELKP